MPTIAMHRPFALAAATAVLLLIASVAATPQTQSGNAAERLAALKPFLGRWQGTAEGQPGRGTVERTYEPALNARFVQVRNRSSYPPQEKNPKGETHEDIGFFGFDNARKRIVFRQFHTEGFVNQYVLESATAERLVFTSEAIENIPPGWRARETYVVLGPDQFEEIFELAEPGQDFATYSRSRFTRVK